MFLSSQRAKPLECARALALFGRQRPHRMKQRRALPRSQTLRRQPKAGSGDATVTPWSHYGEVPMGVDPHGSLTGITPGRHHCHSGTGA